MRINFPNGESASIVWGRKPDWQGRDNEFSFAQAVQRKLLKFDLSIWQQLDRGQINDNQALQKFKAENERQAREAIAQGVAENFDDGKKPGRKGLAKRVGVDCKQPVSKLRSIAANSSGEKQRMAHWCANMKSGRKK